MLIPALNEAQCLPDVLRRMPKGLEPLVIDDGSTDLTARVAEKCGARVIRHETNLGQGTALLTGIRLGLNERFDTIVFIDADGQHDPADIPLLLGKLSEGFDVVVGSRYLPYGPPRSDPAPRSPRYAGPFTRRMLLPLFARVFALRTGLPISDPMSGLRAFRSEILARAFDDDQGPREPQYFSMELYERLRKVGARMGEIPIRIHPRLHGKSKKGFFRYGFGVMRGFARWTIPT